MGRHPLECSTERKQQRLYKRTQKIGDSSIYPIEPQREKTLDNADGIDLKRQSLKKNSELIKEMCT